MGFCLILDLRVSIHTPTWGVTVVRSLRTRCYRVSIHTPTWGVTQSSLTPACLGVFQSTHLHEVWLSADLNRSRYLVFQSTHLHEVWPIDPICLYPVVKFQSTHLHEVWLNFYILRACFWSFNPHTYMRCDVCKFRSKSLPCVSIHTPTWGVTR